MRTPSITDIPVGKENAVSRTVLCKLWGLCDRSVRETVLNMRMTMPEDGYVIVSSSHDAGYWRTNDHAEIQQYIDETEARAKHTFRPLAIARMVRDNIGQIRMSGAEG